MSEIKESILFARRRLEEIEQLEIIDDLCWDDVEKRWYIKICVFGIDSINEGIPSETMWYITFPETYPEGEVIVYPAVDEGIQDTFNHQNNNGLISDNSLWRTGNLCLSNSLDELLHEGIEPCNYEDKLFWNAKRIVAWVKAAARNNLIRKGDYYEKPQFVARRNMILAYNEDLVSFMEWEDSGETIGFVEIIRTDCAQLYADSFYSLSGKLCKSTKWGLFLETHARDSQIGAWILLKKEPVIRQWQAPNNLAELKEAMKLQGRDLIKELKRVIHRFRDGKRHIVMVGFPFPEIIGSDNQQIHWEAFLLPELSSGSNVYNGFRNNEIGRQTRDFYEIIPRKHQLEWVLCDNWNSREILNRGHFERKMTSRRYLIIGAGALGSSIGELLVRGGVYNISVIDDDYYAMGNSARHVLEVDSVGKFKAGKLCDHYNCINPNVSARPIHEFFSKTNMDIIDSVDVVVDCSASDEVLSLLSSFTAQKNKIYISASFGYKVESLFFAFQYGKIFDKEEYYSSLGEKIRISEEKYMNSQLPWDGIGCWSPVFPGMAYDVQMVASFSTGLIKTLIESGVRSSRYFVYEKKYDHDGVVLGFARL